MQYKKANKTVVNSVYNVYHTVNNCEPNKFLTIDCEEKELLMIYYMRALITIMDIIMQHSNLVRKQALNKVVKRRVI